MHFCLVYQYPVAMPKKTSSFISPPKSSSPANIKQTHDAVAAVARPVHGLRSL